MSTARRGQLGDMTARTGQSEQDSQNGTSKMGQAEQDRLNQKDRTGQTEHAC
jgi:hypothetical protein